MIRHLNPFHRNSRPVRATLVAVFSLALGFRAGPTLATGSTELSHGWALRSQTGLADGGVVISQPGYNVSGWYPITIPSTVMAGLVTNGVLHRHFLRQQPPVRA